MKKALDEYPYRMYDYCMRKAQITENKALHLSIIAHCGEPSIHDIMQERRKRSGVTPPHGATHTIVNRLCADGLVRRENPVQTGLRGHPEYTYVITDKGVAEIKAYRAYLAKAHKVKI